MEIKIDLMSEFDIDSVHEISKLSLPESWNRKSYAEEVYNSNSVYIVAKTDSMVVGFAGVLIIAGEGTLSNIAVHPDFRRNKIGERLLKSLIDNSEFLGYKDITLEVRSSNEAAKTLYIKYGFKEEGIRKGYYQDNREDAIIMWRRNK